MGILTATVRAARSEGSFNRRWRFLGGDTRCCCHTCRYLCKFQSQVAILGWGYRRPEIYCHTDAHVSIAGGDSWVGIRHHSCSQSHYEKLFQSQVAILGWGYFVHHISCAAFCFCFNRRWRFLGGDTNSSPIVRACLTQFQSQVAILGWGYDTSTGRHFGFESFNRRWRFLGGDTYAL